MLPSRIKNIEDKENTRIYVAMSGGVDSSTAAYLLRQAGFDVVGCFMTVWQPPFLDCSLEAERQDAMQVAAQLEIPFRTVDLAGAYKQRVVDYMIQEYKAGRTPNPDVMCNGEIKFGTFYDWAREDGADYVATGHYAQTYITDDEEFTLQAGADAHKDQTYFLWQLPSERLEKTLFPIGHLEKSRVRELAEAAEIPVADKDDSQGLCFLGQVDMRTFLAEFIDTTAGELHNEAADVIGSHDGAELYTVGQRHGFDVTKKTPDSGPFYVIDKDVSTNTVTVTEDNTPSGPTYNGHTVTLTETNWLTDDPLPTGDLQVRIRYNQPLQSARLKTDEKTSTVVFEKPLRAVAAGQSCVVYDGDRCLGGGVIDTVSSKNPS